MRDIHGCGVNSGKTSNELHKTLEESIPGFLPRVLDGKLDHIGRRLEVRSLHVFESLFESWLNEAGATDAILPYALDFWYPRRHKRPQNRMDFPDGADCRKCIHCVVDGSSDPLLISAQRQSDKDSPREECYHAQDLWEELDRGPVFALADAGWNSEVSLVLKALECTCNIARKIDLDTLDHYAVLDAKGAEAGILPAETVVDTLHEVHGGFGERLYFIDVLLWENQGVGRMGDFRDGIWRIRILTGSKKTFRCSKWMSFSLSCFLRQGAFADKDH